MKTETEVINSEAEAIEALQTELKRQNEKGNIRPHTFEYLDKILSDEYAELMCEYTNDLKEHLAKQIPTEWIKMPNCEIIGQDCPNASLKGDWCYKYNEYIDRITECEIADQLEEEEERFDKHSAKQNEYIYGKEW